MGQRWGVEATQAKPICTLGAKQNLACAENTHDRNMNDEHGRSLRKNEAVLAGGAVPLVSTLGPYQRRGYSRACTVAHSYFLWLRTVAHGWM